jgi:hypothetical protein
VARYTHKKISKPRNNRAASRQSSRNTPHHREKTKKADTESWKKTNALQQLHEKPQTINTVSKSAE